MIIFFIIFNFLLFQIEEPYLGKIKYPETETKNGIDKRIVSDLKVKMEIDENGIINSFEYIESKNIEKERILEFFNFFKVQLLGKKVKPMLKDGKPTPCTYIYTFSWILYYAPPEIHFVSSKDSSKKNILKTLKGDEKEIEIYEKELEEKAKKIIEPYGLFINDLERIRYFSSNNLKEIEKLDKELKDFIYFFQKSYFNLLDENLNFEQKIFLFPEKKLLLKFLKEEKLPLWADGIYIGPLRSIFTIYPFEKRLMDVFLHEEAHFLINNLLFKNNDLPLFLREGFAEYFLYLYKNQNYSEENIERFKEYKNLINKEKKEKGILSYLFMWDSEKEKKEKDTKKFYAFSFAFIEFISKKENFQKFIYDLKNNGFSKEIFEENFGSQVIIEKEFLDFLKLRY